ncbi:hemolysin III family protein [Opitutus sp. ER46]|uniref:PAQR family membrane homeostasis protein TrhA n=1 Tax=Opitutus sp. ER46 TaxID=2161864 RepID=UPI000D31474A|nr:hemolysin III family protein [Opitutus sp. ER46]PTX97986.1 hemolysin III [Opitutus sp. ER46]
MPSTVKPPSATYTPAEEVANAVSHGIGLVLSVAALVLLVVFAALRGSAWHITACTIFGASLVLLYTSSTLYHSVRHERVKLVLRKLDHAAIFVLIAGTYTPFLLVNLRGPWGWSLFGVIWTLALGGIAMKVWFTGRFRVVSTIIYIVMGWLIIIAIAPMMRVIEPGGIWLLVGGGVCYTGGTVFYLWRSLPYHHAVWHLFVLGGSVCHFFAVFSFVVPRGA